MKLGPLLSIYKEYRLGDFLNREVESICVDSRQFKPNSVWVALRGSRFDGHNFVEAACRGGALAVIVEDDSLVPKDYLGAVVKVQSTKKALQLLAAKYYEDPALKLFCVGVTGTNGKTTITNMVECILNHYGMPTGVLGTIDHHLLEHKWASELTTPDPLTLQKRLSEFCALGAKAAAFEVSSHALDQGRVDSIEFDAVVFSNLTRDHLDYHKTMQEYFAAKEKLFKTLPQNFKHKSCRAIINVNDEWGKKIQVASGMPVWTYGEVKSDFQFQVTKSTFAGVDFNLSSPRGKSEGHLKVAGRHNVYNAVAALAVGVHAGASVHTALEALAEYPGAPGRLQAVPNTKNLFVFVDYAHTENALETVLKLLTDVRRQSHAGASIHTVFGCGGDRDQGKRPNMGRVAATMSDYVYVTSDNPRTEDPEQIIAQILKGIPSGAENKKLTVEIDRRRAIEKALVAAGPGDVILIAGKGHEDYQIIGKNKLPFNDVQIAEEILNGM